MIGSGASSLGWAGGGAIGAKLAEPDRTVVCLVGDGSYLFGVPSVAQWAARRYQTPALTVIYNNRGWRAPKNSTLAVHPDGAAAAADDFNVSFEPAADLPGIAAGRRRCVRRQRLRSCGAAPGPERRPGRGTGRPFRRRVGAPARSLRPGARRNSIERRTIAATSLAPFRGAVAGAGAR